MPRRLSNHTSYLNELDPEQGIRAVQDGTRRLRDIDFDAIAFSGMSGALVAPAIAMALRAPLLLVRKDTDDSHAGKGRVEGALDAETYVIVDDFISSGATLKRMHAMINSALSVHRRAYPGNKPAICVGVFLYRYNEFYTAENVRDSGHAWLSDIIVPSPPKMVVKEQCGYTGIPVELNPVA